MATEHRRGRGRSPYGLSGLVVVLVVIAAAGCGSARHLSSATPSRSTQATPSSTQIIYTCVPHLCAIGGDGANPRILHLPRPGYQSQSAPSTVIDDCVLSPDGKRAACPEATEHSSGLLSDLRLVIGNSDGTDLHRIWSPPSDSYFNGEGRDSVPVSGVPAWNPAGNRLAVVVPQLAAHASDEIINVVWVMDVDGAHAHRVNGPNGRPLQVSADAALAWSPDGNNLAVGGRTGLATVPAAGGQSRTVGNPAPGSSGSEYLSLSWSPTADTIAAVTFEFAPSNRHDELDVYPAGGGAPRVLQVSPLQPTAAYYSPDGKHIVVSVNGAATPMHDAVLVVANADGSDPTPLPNLALPFTNKVTGWVGPA